MTEQLLSIVLPVYNQADHIAETVAGYEAALGRIPVRHEILLVINGSRDESLSVCRGLAQTHASVRALASVRSGWGMAVKVGLQAAQGNLLCYTNSARTSPQDLLLFALYAIANPGTVIKANRKNRVGWQRRLGSLLYNIECRVLFDLPYWDINGTPKFFPRAFDKLLALTSEDDLIDVEFANICRSAGYPMLEVPIFSNRRHGGASTTRYSSAARMYLGALRLWREGRKAGSRD
jgi:glycosyltransferase involved in cell wall biosynthesis